MAEDEKMGRLVKQVSMNADGHVSVVWTTQNGATPETHEIEDCIDGPRKQFKDAWAALVPFALDLVEIADERWKGARLSQVRVNVDPRQRRNYVMTLVKTLEHGGTVINTPMRMERADESEVGAQYTSPELLKAITKVFDEAATYAIEQDRHKVVIEMELDDERKSGSRRKKQPEHEAEVEFVEDGSGEAVRDPKPRARVNGGDE